MTEMFHITRVRNRLGVLPRYLVRIEEATAPGLRPEPISRTAVLDVLAALGYHTTDIWDAINQADERWRQQRGASG